MLAPPRRDRLANASWLGRGRDRLCSDRGDPVPSCCAVHPQAGFAILLVLFATVWSYRHFCLSGPAPQNRRAAAVAGGQSEKDLGWRCRRSRRGGCRRFHRGLCEHRNPPGRGRSSSSDPVDCRPRAATFWSPRSKRRGFDAKDARRADPRTWRGHGPRRWSFARGLGRGFDRRVAVRYGITCGRSLAMVAA